MAMPAASAMGNERNSATSAAASAASTTLVIPCTDRVMIGETRMAASPASAEPRAQLTVATVSDDRPIDAAARWFSATAEVARPNVV